MSTGLTILLVGILISATDNLDMLFWVFAASTVGFMVCSAITKVDESSTLDEEQQRLLDDNMPAMASTNSRHVHHLHHPTTLYQSLSRHDTDDDDDHLSYTTALETYQQQRLLKLTTTTSIVSMARTLREEANDALECCSSSINNNNLGLAVSRVMSVEHTAGIMAEDSDSVQMPSTSTFRSPRVFGYLITTLLCGVVLSIIVNFLFLFLSDNLHMPASWIGWTGPLGGLTELFSFFYSKQVCGNNTDFIIMVCSPTRIMISDDGALGCYEIGGVCSFGDYCAVSGLHLARARFCCQPYFGTGITNIAWYWLCHLLGYFCQ